MGLASAFTGKVLPWFEPRQKIQGIRSIKQYLDELPSDEDAKLFALRDECDSVKSIVKVLGKRFGEFVALANKHKRLQSISGQKRKVKAGLFARKRQRVVEVERDNPYSRVKVWVGSFATQEVFNRYLAETYGDGEPISQFAADMGETFYDHDFLETSFHKEPIQDVKQAFKQHSFSEHYVERVSFDISELNVGEFNAIIEICSDEIKSTNSIVADEYKLSYIGQYKYDLDADQTLAKRQGCCIM